jgi:AcrR family transcriptional regulator
MFHVGAPLPIEVDKDRRRDDVVTAAGKLIAEGGLDAVTFRNLARELQCSTTSISHYFPSMRDVLLATYRQTADRAAARREALMSGGGADVVGVLQQILPLGDQQSRDWKVWLCFWTSALFDPVLAEEQKQRSRATVGQIARLLLASGWTGPDVQAVGQSIMTTIYGIAVQAIFDPEHWPPEMQRRALRKAVDAIMDK